MLDHTVDGHGLLFRLNRTHLLGLNMDSSNMASEMSSEIDSGVQKMTGIGKAIQKGFTLVELLIVVIILAILAAIVVPQFSASTDDAKLSALDSNLAALRSSINYYYQQHGEYPSTMISTSCSGAGAVAGTATVGQTDNFTNQLTAYSSDDGLVCGTRDTTYSYGPYLRKMPENPLTGIATVRIVTTGALQPTGAATPAGWLFDSVSGRIVVDDAANDDR